MINPVKSFLTLVAKCLFCLFVYMFHAPRCRKADRRANEIPLPASSFFRPSPSTGTGNYQARLPGKQRQLDTNFSLIAAKSGEHCSAFAKLYCCL